MLCLCGGLLLRFFVTVHGAQFVRWQDRSRDKSEGECAVVVLLCARGTGRDRIRLLVQNARFVRVGLLHAQQERHGGAVSARRTLPRFFVTINGAQFGLKTGVRARW